MKKEYRIKKSEEIETLVKAKKSVGNKFFVIYKSFDHANTHFRYAVSVSKKYGKAVERNLVKRRVRHVVDNLIDLDNTMNFFIVIKPTVKELDFEQIKNQLITLLSKNIKGDKNEN